MYKTFATIALSASLVACSTFPGVNKYAKPDNLLFQINTIDAYKIHVQRDEKLCADDQAKNQKCATKLYIDDFKAGDFYINNSADFYLKEGKYQFKVKNCTNHCENYSVSYCVNEKSLLNNLLLTVDNNGKPIILNNDGTTINNCPIRENALNNVIKPIEPSLDNINLAADSLFKFNGGKLTDLLPAGKSSLNELATKLNNQYARIDMIKLTGHTDRLGSEKYNQQLALQRALTVKNYLMNQGIAADKLSFASAGETQPVTNGCFDVQDRNALKACLQADRRVDVQILGIKKP